MDGCRLVTVVTEVDYRSLMKPSNPRSAWVEMTRFQYDHIRCESKICVLRHVVDRYVDQIFRRGGCAEKERCQKQSFGIQCSTYQIFLTATDRIGSFSGPIKILEHVGGLLEFYHRAAG